MNKLPWDEPTCNDLKKSKNFDPKYEILKSNSGTKF